MKLAIFLLISCSLIACSKKPEVIIEPKVSLQSHSPIASPSPEVKKKDAQK